MPVCVCVLFVEYRLVLETMNDDNSLSFELSASILLASDSYKVRERERFDGGDISVLITKKLLHGMIVNCCHMTVYVYVL